MSRKRKYLQKALIIFLIITGLFGCSGKDTSQTEAGFATAEEAVLSYLAGLRDQDFGRMEDSFFDKSRAVDISTQYAYLCGIDQMSELASEGYVKLSEEGEAERFLEELKGKIEETDLGSMEFLGFVLPGDMMDSSTTEAYQDYLKRIAQTNGFSELENQVAAIQVGETKYFLFFDTVKVEDRWYVFQLGSVLLDLAGMDMEEGMVVPLDAEDEEKLEMLLVDNADIPKLPESAAGEHERGRTESGGYDTPEEAVTAYLEGLKSCDIEQMVSTFSVESYAQNYSMQAYLEYMQAYMFLQQEVPLPPVNDFIAAMICCDREEQLKEEVLSQGNALYLWDCYYHDTKLEQGASFEWEELQEMLDLSSIEVVEFVLPETIAEKSASEQADALRDQRAGICGADKQQDCVVIFTCGGEKYCLFMEEMQYNGKWYNSGFGNFAFSAIGGYEYTKGTMPYEMLEQMNGE